MPVTADFFELTPRNWRARLAVSVDVMRELSRYTNSEEMYHVFVRRMSQLYPTSRQISLSRKAMRWPNFRVTRYNLWPERVNPRTEAHLLPNLRGGLLADLLYADEPRVIDDLQLNANDPAYDYLADQRSLLAIPLFENGEATNMVIVTREETSAFPREQVPELVWMSNLFGRAMETLALTERLKSANESAAYELKVIAELQHSLLPGRLPELPGLELAVHYQPANQSGGDYYDFFPLPNGRLGILIADVSGHGTPAAVLMSITHSLAHAYAVPPESPGLFLAYLNMHLAKRYTVAHGHFITAFYGVFDPNASTLTYANAGHLPPRIHTRATQKWVPIPANLGLPLGVNIGQAAYPERTLPFDTDSTLMLFTDGITEANDRFAEPFGSFGLDAALEDCDACSSQQIVAAVIDRLKQFTLNAPLEDDRTLVVVRTVGLPT